MTQYIQSTERVPVMHQDLARRLNVQIAYDGGIKVKDGEGPWSPPMTYPESFGYLTHLARSRNVALPEYLT